MDKEEYGYVIYKMDYKNCVFVLGNKNFTPLELLLKNNETCDLLDKLYLGEEKRDKVQNVNKWISEIEFQEANKLIVYDAIQKIILDNEQKYLEFINSNKDFELQKKALAISFRLGPKTTEKILDAKKEKEFNSLKELEYRAKTNIFMKNLIQKIYNEISGKDKLRIFANKAKHL